MKSIYLGGPITGCSYGGAMDWRENLTQKLVELGVEVISPMRAMSHLKNETKIADTYDEKLAILSTAKGITYRCKWDVSRCDILLANFLGAKKVSIGTVTEIAWAHAWGKPIITVMEEDNIHQHSMLNEISSLRTSNLDSALEIIEGFLF